MTHPGGSGNINLAALWIPLMPETSQMEAKAKEGGERAGRAWQQGFSSTSGNRGAQEFGESFANRVAESLNARIRNTELGFGVSPLIDKISEQVDKKLAEKLKGQLPQLYREATSATKGYTEALERETAVADRAADAQVRLNAAKDALNARVTKSAEVTRIVNELTAQGVTYQNAMAEAHQRTRTTENDLIDIKKRHVAAEQELHSIQLQQISAHKEVEEETTKVSAAQEQYTGKLNEFHAASKQVFGSTEMFAGLMGGAMVLGIQGVVSGFEHLIELGEHIFEAAIEGAQELSEKLIEVGEDYAHLDVQLTEFSSATGETMDNMQEHVSSIFNSLDVAGKEVGQTYAQLGSILNLQAGQPLDDLTRRVTELQGRYSGLKAADLGGIFTAFKTPVDELNSSLATLVAAGQASGQGLAAITSGLSGGGADVLAHAGLSLGQAANAVGEFERHGIPANQVMTALQTSMKLFAKDGQDFKTGLQGLLRDLSNPNYTDKQKDSLAAAAFGARRWADGLAIVKGLISDIDAGPTAFDKEAGATDEFLEKTATLDNKIEEFKHHLEGTFQPFGTAAIDFAEHGLEKVKDWFDQHHTEIVAKIKEWGDKFIDMLPKIKQWAVIAGRLIADFSAVAATALLPLMENMAIIGAAALAFTGNFKEAGMMLAAPLRITGEVDNMAVKANNLLDKLENLDIPTGKWKDDFNSIADAAGRLGDSAPFQLSFGKPGEGGPGEGGPPQGGATPGPPPGPGMWYTAGGEPVWGSEEPGYVGGPGMTQGHPPAPTGPPPPPGAHPNTGAEPHPPQFDVTPPAGPYPNMTPNSGGPHGFNPVHPGAFTSNYTGPVDQLSMARAIYGAVTGAGYSSRTGLYSVAAGMLESGLNPNNPNNPTHFGLFQETEDKPHNGPAEQINWFVNTLNSLGGPSVVDRDPATWIANHVEIGGYSGSRYDSFLKQAESLLGVTAPDNDQTQGPILSAARGGSPGYKGDSLGGGGVLSNLFGGIFQSLGFPDLFGDPKKNRGVFSLIPGLGQMISGIKGFDGGGSPGGGRGDPGDPNVPTFPFNPNDVLGLRYRNTGQFNPNVSLDTSMARIDSWNSPLSNFGFATGGLNPKDTIPAMLAPKEYVWNERAVEMFGPFINWANQAALQGQSGMPSEVKGFVVGGSSDGSAMPSLNTQGAQIDTIAISEAVAQAFGITDIGMYRGADKFHEHSSGEAADVMVGTDNPIGYDVKDFALAHAADFGVQYVIWQNKLWYPDGSVENYGADPSDVTNSHRNHDHIATAGGGFPPGASPGADYSKGLPTSHPNSDTPAPGAYQMLGGSMDFGSPGGDGGYGSFTSAGYGSGGYSGGGGVLSVKGGTGGGHSGGYGPVGGGPDGSVDPRTGLPGLPGQYGGFGQYGGETQDEIEQHRRDVRDRQHHIEDLKRQQAKIENEELPKLNKQLTEAEGKIGAERDEDKIANLRNQIDDLTRQRDKIRDEELPDANTDLGTAEHKQQEAADKPPKGMERKQKTGEGDAAHELGTGLLSGIGQSLGFPDVFGKPPWEFGSFKLLAGLMNWGWGEMNMLGDALGWKPGAGFANARPGSGLPGAGGAPGGGMHLPGIPGASQFSPHGKSPLIDPNSQGGMGLGGPVFGSPPVPGQTSPPGQWGSPGPGNQPIVYNDNRDHSITVNPATDAGIKTGVQELQNSHNYAQGIANAPSFPV